MRALIRALLSMRRGRTPIKREIAVAREHAGMGRHAARYYRLSTAKRAARWRLRTVSISCADKARPICRCAGGTRSPLRAAASNARDACIDRKRSGNGGHSRTRTYDPLIKSQLLYQLSYVPRAGGSGYSKGPLSCRADWRPRAASRGRPEMRGIRPKIGRRAALEPVARAAPADSHVAVHVDADHEAEAEQDREHRGAAVGDQR